MKPEDIPQLHQPDVRQLRLRIADVEADETAIVVQAADPRELSLSVLKYYHHRRQWDLPLALFAVLPLNYPGIRVFANDLLAYQVPVRSRKPDAPWFLLAPVPLNTHADYDVPTTVFLSAYHQLIGITLPVEAVGSILVFEGYTAPYVAGNTRAAADRVDGNEVRMAAYLGEAGTASAQQIRGGQPQLFGEGLLGSGAVGLTGGEMTMFQRAGLPSTVNLPTFSDTEIPLALAWEDFERWVEANVVTGANSGLNPEDEPDEELARFLAGDTDSLVRMAMRPMPTEMAEKFIEGLRGGDLRSVVRCHDDSPPIILTEELEDWFTPTVLVNVILGVPIASSPREFWVHLRRLVVFADMLVNRQDELVASGFTLFRDNPEVPVEMMARVVVRKLTEAVKADPTASGVLSAPISELFDDQLLYDLDEPRESLIHTAVEVYGLVAEAVVEWVASVAGTTVSRSF